MSAAACHRCAEPSSVNLGEASVSGSAFHFPLWQFSVNYRVWLRELPSVTRQRGSGSYWRRGCTGSVSSNDPHGRGCYQASHEEA